MGNAALAALSGAQLPPHDLDAERAMLGACMLNNDVLADIESIATPADCYHPAHASIFEAVLTVTRRGEPADVVTIAAELRRDERLASCGGGQYLGELADRISTTAWAAHHARIVARLARKRRIALAATEIAGRAMQPGTTDDEDAEFAASTIQHASEKRDDGDAVSLAVAMDESLEATMNALAAGKRISGIETGFHDYDTLTTGMHPGQLIIVAGRPGTGKTSFAMGIAAHVARNGGTALVFSLEMPRADLAQRFLASESRINQTLIRTLQIGKTDVDALARVTESSWELPVYIDDRPGVNIHMVRAKCRRMKRKRGLALVVIDYIQLMRGAGEENRQQEVANISRGLKELAKELEVPVIALAQLNRGPEARSTKDHRPKVADLRESGQIEQDADNVTLLYRDELYDDKTSEPGIAEVIIGKQRSGPFPRTIKMRFVGEFTRFESMTPNPRGVSVDDMQRAVGDDNDW